MSDNVHETTARDWEFVELPADPEQTQPATSGERDGHHITSVTQDQVSQRVRAIKGQEDASLSTDASTGLEGVVANAQKKLGELTDTAADELLWKQCETYEEQASKARASKKTEEATYWKNAYTAQLTACLIDPASRKLYTKIAQCWAAAAKCDARSDQKGLEENKTREAAHLAQAAHYSAQAAEQLIQRNSKAAQKFIALAKSSARDSTALKKNWVGVATPGD